MLCVRWYLRYSLSYRDLEEMMAEETAGRTLQGYEVMHMLRKGQVSGVGKGDIGGQVSFIASLFGVVA